MSRLLLVPLLLAPIALHASTTNIAELAAPIAPIESPEILLRPAHRPVEPEVELSSRDHSRMSPLVRLSPRGDTQFPSHQPSPTPPSAITEFPSDMPVRDFSATTSRMPQAQPAPELESRMPLKEFEITRR